MLETGQNKEDVYQKWEKTENGEVGLHKVVWHAKCRLQGIGDNDSRQDEIGKTDIAENLVNTHALGMAKLVKIRIKQYTGWRRRKSFSYVKFLAEVYALG